MWLPWAAAAATAGLAAFDWLSSGRSLIAALRLAHAAPAASQGASAFTRLSLWRVAWEAFRDHPLLGVGPNNYRIVFSHYFQGKMEGQLIWASAHNLYLQQLAERGILGFAALAAVLGALAFRAFRRARENPNAWNLWAWGAVAAFLVMNLTETAFQNEQTATFFLFIWAWSQANAQVPAAKTP